eukprot:TRINITY_DN26338_c0_g1_i1.p1 TRINITY_DN26338_c0_g1~~TRINITY_DN26338_c0_g1_i1.p1  ORF type:complete len:163 (-),score=42.79 TRINITY_DN26338_c0_g1_i1:15-503(-)
MNKQKSLLLFYICIAHDSESVEKGEMSFEGLNKLLLEKDSIIRDLRRKLEEECLQNAALKGELRNVMKLFIEERNGRTRHFTTRSRGLSQEDPERRRLDSLRETNIRVEEADELDLEGNPPEAASKLQNRVHGRWRRTGMSLSVLSALRSETPADSLEAINL